MRVLIKKDNDLIALESDSVSNLWGGPGQGYQVGFNCTIGLVCVDVGENKEAGDAIVREAFDKGCVDLSENENAYLDYTDEDVEDDE